MVDWAWAVVSGVTPEMMMVSASTAANVNRVMGYAGNLKVLNEKGRI